MDQIKSNEEIISFDYNTSDSSSYSTSVSDSVKMKYLGDENKDIFLKCDVNYRLSYYYSSSYNYEYNYHISCYLNDVSKLNEGNYCIQIVNELVGNIGSRNFCSDLYTFKVTKSTNIPVLSLT